MASLVSRPRSCQHSARSSGQRTRCSRQIRCPMRCAPVPYAALRRHHGNVWIALGLTVFSPVMATGIGSALPSLPLHRPPLSSRSRPASQQASCSTSPLWRSSSREATPWVAAAYGEVGGGSTLRHSWRHRPDRPHRQLIPSAENLHEVRSTAKVAPPAKGVPRPLRRPCHV